MYKAVEIHLVKHHLLPLGIFAKINNAAIALLSIDDGQLDPFGVFHFILNRINHTTQRGVVGGVNTAFSSGGETQLHSAIDDFDNNAKT